MFLFFISKNKFTKIFYKKFFDNTFYKKVLRETYYIHIKQLGKNILIFYKINHLQLSLFFTIFIQILVYSITTLNTFI